MGDYLERHATPFARDVLDAFPVTVIEGARQVGKSTFAGRLASGRDARIVTLDDDSIRAAAEEDPVTFVSQNPAGLLVIDEVQRTPGLLLAIKAAVDRDRRPGRFLLTGSSDLLRNPGAPESLAGRAVTVRLDGFSQGELVGRVDDFIARVASGFDPNGFESDLTRADYVDRLSTGGYPELHRLPGRLREVWIDAYVDRLITRDARDLTRAPSPARSATLLRLLAANQSGELVKSRLARDSGIPETSITSAIDLLRALFLVETLRPWTPNLTSREIGRVKAFVADSALSVRLARLREAALAAPTGSAHLGGQLEGFVAGELRRQAGWSSRPHELFHYRDRDGLEVDLVAELDDGRVIGVEIRAGATVKSGHFTGLRRMRERLGERFIAGVVPNTASRGQTFADRLCSLPVSALWQL